MMKDALDEITLDGKEFQDDITKLKNLLSEEYRKFDLLKRNIEKEREMMKRRKLLTDDVVIELNVGGEYFTTMKSTLEKVPGSMLDVMFNSKFFPGVKDKSGRWFLDRPPKYFGIILDALRSDGPLLVLEDDVEDLTLVEEVKYMGLADHFKISERETRSIFPKCTLLKPKEQKMIYSWMTKKSGKKSKLIYKATVDGFQALKFRSIVASQSPTIVIVRSSNGFVFGGYSVLPWSSGNSYAYNSDCFLFACPNKYNHNTLTKYPNTGPHHGNQYSIYNGNNYHATFGGGHDLYICDKSNQLQQSYSNLGHSYSATGFAYGTQGIQQLLAGSYQFLTNEIEVYSV